MQEMVLKENSSLTHAHRRLKDTKVKGPSKVAGSPLNDESLRNLVPSREMADRFVQDYLRNVEPIHRVLHLPTFKAEYDAFWNCSIEARPGFIALLLLIFAIVNCRADDSASMFRGDSSLKRESASLWIHNVDMWLQQQSHKHVSVINIQLHCLTLLAKIVNSIKRKRIWVLAGSLLRNAISAGLHRDAQIVNMRHPQGQRKKISAFNQEMRRRIWVTIAELDLQASLERGMPAATRDLYEDSGLLSNLKDTDLDQSCEELPAPQPLAQFTESSYQHLTRSSWSLRLELVSLLNNPRQLMPYENVLRYDQKILQQLDEIPRWDDPESLIVQALLQLQLHQFLLYLHRPYVHKEQQGSRHEYSTHTHLKSAMVMLDLHDQLVKAGNSHLCLLRSDAITAALSICYNKSFSDPKIGKYLNTVQWSMYVGTFLNDLFL